MNQRLSIRLCALLTALALLVVCAALTGCEEKEQATPSSATPISAATRDEPTPGTTATQAATAATASSDAAESAATDPSAPTAPQETIAGEIKTPDALKKLMKTADTSADELYWLGCQQLVTVESSGSDARIRFFTFSGNSWTEKKELACSGYVGHNGVTADMHEGGMATPFGLYSIGEAFYFNDPPKTGLATFRVTEDTYWVDDPDSAYYNRRMEGTAQKDWNSAEHMIDYPDTYEYGFVIDYNTAAAYAKGSAIFFHIKYEPTYGCVATNRDSVLQYLAALDSDAYPYILIV